MTQVTQNGQAGGRSVADKRVDLDYDDLGRRETLSRYADLAGTALVAATGYTFDLNGRLTGLEHKQNATTFADYGYAYDALGRLIEESTLAETRDYYYDAVGQLTGVDSSLAGRDEVFAYDATGNRTSNAGDPGPGNRLLEDANYVYQYDAEGNRTQRTSKADGSREIYWWDHRNRLIRVNFRTAANVLTQAVAYDYDAFDNLIRRRVDANGDGSFEESQSFVLDLGGKGGLDDVVLPFDDTGNVEHRYLHGDGIDELWADESTADGLLWALADRQGTVKDWAEHDSGTGTTSIYDHVEFDAYGNIVSQTNANHEITAGGYTGRYHDPLTGLRYHRRRWTDPSTGWISEDPGGFAMGDVNLYRYVGNGPGKAADPSGLQEFYDFDPTTDYPEPPHSFGPTLPPGSDWPPPNPIDEYRPPIPWPTRYPIVRNAPPINPFPPMSPLLPSHGDICIGGEVTLIGGTGIKVGVGGVGDLDTPMDSGAYLKIGAGGGVDVGGSGSIGYTPGDIEGGATETDVSIGPFSGQGAISDSGDLGGSFGLGGGLPGGAAISRTETYTLSIGTICNFLTRPPRQNPYPYPPPPGWDGTFPTGSSFR